MIKGGKGGANTNITGLKFEKEVEFSTIFNNLDNLSLDSFEYFPKEGEKFFRIKQRDTNTVVGYFMKKSKLYQWLKESEETENLNYKNILSKNLEADGIILLIDNGVHNFYIFEKKYQESEGSVDEKLQTFEYKLYQYRRVLEKANIGYTINFAYILSDKFKTPKYSDNLNYITLKGAKYFFQNDSNFITNLLNYLNISL